MKHKFFIKDSDGDGSNANVIVKIGKNKTKVKLTGMDTGYKITLTLDRDGNVVLKDALEGTLTISLCFLGDLIRMSQCLSEADPMVFEEYIIVKTKEKL